MGFMRKALFVATGGASGVVVRANSKKDRSARAAEESVRLQREQLRLQREQLRLEQPPRRALAPAYDFVDDVVPLDEDEQLDPTTLQLMIDFIHAVPESELGCRESDADRCGECWACQAHAALVALRSAL